MQHIIITKRIEPYDLIEGIKKNFEVEDYTFIGMNKFEILDKFLANMQNVQTENTAFGLYMKNVNKFYLAKSKAPASDIENQIKNVLANILSIDTGNLETAEGITLTQSRDKAISSVDMGKSEASIITA